MQFFWLTYEPILTWKEEFKFLVNYIGFPKEISSSLHKNLFLSDKSYIIVQWITHLFLFDWSEGTHI